MPETIWIEHPGTRYYNTLASKIKTMVEVDFGVNVETMIGDLDNLLCIYTDTGDKIYETSVMPSSAALRLYISLAT